MTKQEKIEKMKSLREGFKVKQHIFAHKRWATEEECEILYNIVKEGSIKRVVEIGTANGWTAAWFALAGATVYTFDLIDRPKMYLDDLFPFPELAKNIHFQAVPSPECLTLVPKSEDKTLWFIDADHTYAAVLKDYEAVKDHCKPGDYIAQHDAGAEVGSKRVWGQTIQDDLGENVFYNTRNGIGLTKVRT